MSNPFDFSQIQTAPPARRAQPKKRVAKTATRAPAFPWKWLVVAAFVTMIPVALVIVLAAKLPAAANNNNKKLQVSHEVDRVTGNILVKMTYPGQHGKMDSLRVSLKSPGQPFLAETIASPSEIVNGYDPVGLSITCTDGGTLKLITGKHVLTIKDKSDAVVWQDTIDVAP